MTEGLPRCPRDCGGSIGGRFPHILTSAQRSLRKSWGCDTDAAQDLYTVTCAYCDGSMITPEGERCVKCTDRGPMRGKRGLRRCPTSHIDYAISDALRSYPYLEGGRFPAPGGLMDQSPSFLHFASVLSSECAVVRKEEQEDAKTKSDAKAKSAKMRKK